MTVIDHVHFEAACTPAVCTQSNDQLGPVAGLDNARTIRLACSVWPESRAHGNQLGGPCPLVAAHPFGSVAVLLEHVLQPILVSRPDTVHLASDSGSVAEKLCGTGERLVFGTLDVGFDDRRHAGAGELTIQANGPDGGESAAVSDQGGVLIAGTEVDLRGSIATTHGSLHHLDIGQTVELGIAPQCGGVSRDRFISNNSSGGPVSVAAMRVK